LGASRVGRVLDLKASNAILHKQTRNNGEQHRWDWLYVDDQEEAAAEEMAMSKSGHIAHGSRKRKRYSSSVEAHDETATSENLIRVMSNEFVCQSLILGRFWK